MSIAVYRVVQEALANVVKHASASHAAVELHSESSGYRITISDDGRGFDAREPTSAGIGLISMRERMNAAGGSISIESAPGSGTRIVVHLPTGMSNRNGKTSV